VKLLRGGQRVLDLGAYPGSWTQYAASRIGPKGKILAFDLQEHRGPFPPNVEWRTADVLKIDPAELGTFDVVISDMAPSTSGQKALDQARSFELFMQALTIAKRVLVPGGAFVAKIFQGGDFPEAQKAIRAAFAQTKIIRPEATRSESYETFLIGLGKR
jgi:23S rRNA (uridine2552-2'-O)-methyltransferase